MLAALPVGIMVSPAPASRPISPTGRRHSAFPTGNLAVSLRRQRATHNAVPTARKDRAKPRRSLTLTGFGARHVSSKQQHNRDSVKINIEDFSEALDVVGDSAGQEVAIGTQFALGLAVIAAFRTDEIEPARTRELLRLRIAHHRAAQQMSSITVH
jgi:hypothetical protein